MRQNTFLPITLACLGIVLSITIILSPWDIVFNNKYEQGIYLLIIIIAGVLSFCFSIKKLLKTKPWQTISLALLSTCLLGFFLVQSFLLSSMHKSTYQKLYSKPNNPNEFIEITHYGRTLGNFNQQNHYILYPKFHLSLQRPFKQEALNGLWIVEKGNPYFKQGGLINFKNGKPTSQP